MRLWITQLLYAETESPPIKSRTEPAYLTYNNADMTITVVYDNNPYKEGLGTAWGFSCLVISEGKVITAADLQ